MTERHGRRRPYTELGIRRLPCFRCGQRPARYQWQVCADNGLYRPLCADCDVELNRMVLVWMNYPDAERVAREYEARVARASG